MQSDLREFCKAKPYQDIFWKLLLANLDFYIVSKIGESAIADWVVLRKDPISMPRGWEGT